MDVVAAGAQDFGAFELHAPEAGAGVEDEVVALAVYQGWAGLKPKVLALSMKAASESSPVRLGLRRANWVFAGLVRVEALSGFMMDVYLSVDKKRRSYWLRLD